MSQQSNNCAIAVIGIDIGLREDETTMEDRSFRHMRTLVTLMVRFACALISMMAPSTRAPTRGRIH